MSSGSTVNTLKRGGKKRKSSAKASQKVTQKVVVQVGLPPRQPNYRNVRAPPTMPSRASLQPLRISPPEFRLMEPPRVLDSAAYAAAASVLRGQGTDALRPGTVRTCKDIAQPWTNVVNPNDIAQWSGSTRLTPTMNYNDPANSRIISGNIPPTLSQFAGGTGPLQESSTSSALKPENKTVHLYSSGQYESSMGMAPVSAQAAFSPQKPLSKPVFQPGSGLKKPEPSGIAPGGRLHPRVEFEEEAKAALARGGVF